MRKSTILPRDAGSVQPRILIGVVAAVALVVGGWALLRRDTVPSPLVPLRILENYPHDRDAFTQGLLFQDGVLVESTGRKGQSSLRKVEVATGNVLERVTLDADLFAEGLALAGDTLVQLTWKAGRALKYRWPGLERAGEWAYEGEGWGLTFDGKRFVMSDGSSVLQFRDPKDFRVLGRITVRDGELEVRFLNELEWVRGEIWANVWHSDKVMCIDPDTGRVLRRLDGARLRKRVGGAASGDMTLNGIAWDEKGERVFMTGKLWPQLFLVSE